MKPISINVKSLLKSLERFIPSKFTYLHGRLIVRDCKTVERDSHYQIPLLNG